MMGNRRKYPDPDPGHKFGKWTVIQRESIKMWSCQCECGTVRQFTRNYIAKENSKSCGCVFFKHGGSSGSRGNQHRLYDTWHGMLQRCLNPTCKDYPKYGGRGISVCEKWREFLGFISDMEHSFVEGTSLGRVNNDLGYYPENCRWETPVEQNNNRSNNHFLCCYGLRMTVAQWSRHLGIHHNVLHGRIGRGWSDEKIIHTPFIPRNVAA